MPIIDSATGQPYYPASATTQSQALTTVVGSSYAPPTASPSSTGPLSNRAVKIVGFLVAGAVLVGLADVAPEAGVGLTAVLGLGVLLFHANELQQLSNGLSNALGQPATA